MVVFFRTIILYLLVVLVMRVMGKRQIGELQPFELVIAIMLSELAAVPMQDTGIPLTHGIIPIITLMSLEILLSYINLKSERARKVLCGMPSIIIKDGKILEEEMRRQRFTLTDLLEETRLKGYLDISDIEFALIENSGKLSIIPKLDASPLTKKDMKIKGNEPLIPITLILDGILNEENLNLSGHDYDWLNRELKKNSINDYKDVLIAMIDSKGKVFIQRR